MEPLLHRAVLGVEELDGEYGQLPHLRDVAGDDPVGAEGAARDYGVAIANGAVDETQVLAQQCRQVRQNSFID